MIVTLPGRSRVIRNPFVPSDENALALAGDSLTRMLNSQAVSTLLRMLVLLAAATLALGARLAATG